MPARHTRQVLSAHANGAMTNSPGRTVVTSDPTSRTIPTNSCPIRARPHLVDPAIGPQVRAAHAARADLHEGVGRPQHLGSGTSVTRMSNAPWIVVARMNPVSRVRAGWHHEGVPPRRRTPRRGLGRPAGMPCGRLRGRRPGRRSPPPCGSPWKSWRLGRARPFGGGASAPVCRVQCIAGPVHRRGTPPSVVETDPVTWLEVATGQLSWDDALASGRVTASGERAALDPWLPLPLTP
jgi:hypothetical protein